MPETDIQLAPDGTVVSPNFHDAHLSGIDVRSERSTKLYFSTVRGEPFCLELLDVDRLRVSDFRQGNIVLDVQVRRFDQCEGEVVRDLYGISPQQLDEPESSVWTARRQLLVLQVNPSYGAHLLAAFRQLRLSRPAN